jgi:hypothetical protein
MSQVAAHGKSSFSGKGPTAGKTGHKLQEALRQFLTGIPFFAFPLTAVYRQLPLPLSFPHSFQSQRTSRARHDLSPVSKSDDLPHFETIS